MLRKVDRAWFEDALERKRFRSATAFAKAIGLTESKWSLALSGKRRVQMGEIARIVAALDVTPAAVARALGMEYADPLLENVLKIEASVGDDGIVTKYLHGSDNFGAEEIEIPFIAYGGTGVAIKTDTLSPRYLRGEVLAAGLNDEDPNLFELDQLIGRDVIATFPDGMAIKNLQSGTQQGRYTFLSLCPGLPPIVDVIPIRVRRIDFHIPLGRAAERFR